MTAERGGKTAAKDWRSRCITTSMWLPAIRAVPAAARRTTERVVTTTGGSDDHFEIEGGDGGWMVYHPGKANQVYASYYNMNITRIRGTQRRDVSPPAPKSEKENVWMVYITLDPNKPATVFTGSNRVWRSKNDGTTWRPVSGSLDGSS